MDLTRVLAASLVAVTLGLGLQKAGIVARHLPEPPHPPTPAFLATEAARSAARSAAGAAEQSREAARVAAPLAAPPPATPVPAVAEAPSATTVALAAATPVAETPIAETPLALPEGPGRDATFQACTGCHGTAIIRRSRLSRDRWDELMDWMTERHGMPPLQGETRVEIVDYLAAAFQPQRRGGGNPFLTPTE